MRVLESPSAFVFVRRAMLALLVLGSVGAAAARAEGTFVSAPSRVDVAYDDARDLLYISNATQVLRYQVSTNTFLAPVTLGGSLAGMDISPDSSTLAVADFTYDDQHNWVHLVNLDTLADNKVDFDLAFDEGGTYTVAYGKDGKLLITSQFEGSGGVPLRRYDPVAGTTTTVGDVDQNTMLRTSANGKVIAIAEPNNSGGPYGNYDVKNQTLDLDHGTGWFTYEIGVDRKAKIYAIPTYFGTFIADRDLALTGTVIGEYAGEQPIAAAFHPKKSLVYFPFAGTNFVKVYNTKTWTEVDEFDFENEFSTTGNWAFTNGRAKTSKNGSLLFVTVDGGVRYVRTKHHHH